MQANICVGPNRFHKTIQSAVDAVRNDQITEIRIDPGEYTETVNLGGKYEHPLKLLGDERPIVGSSYTQDARKGNFIGFGGMGPDLVVGGVGEHANIVTSVPISGNYQLDVQMVGAWDNLVPATDPDFQNLISGDKIKLSKFSDSVSMENHVATVHSASGNVITLDNDGGSWNTFWNDWKVDERRSFTVLPNVSVVGVNETSLIIAAYSKEYFCIKGIHFPSSAPSPNGWNNIANCRNLFLSGVVFDGSFRMTNGNLETKGFTTWFAYVGLAPTGHQFILDAFFLGPFSWVWVETSPDGFIITSTFVYSGNAPGPGTGPSAIFYTNNGKNCMGLCEFVRCHKGLILEGGSFTNTQALKFTQCASTADGVCISCSTNSTISNRFEPLGFLFIEAFQTNMNFINDSSYVATTLIRLDLGSSASITGDSTNRGMTVDDTSFVTNILSIDGFDMVSADFLSDTNYSMPMAYPSDPVDGESYAVPAAYTSSTPAHPTSNAKIRMGTLG
jgi:hypothetical protein